MSNTKSYEHIDDIIEELENRAEKIKKAIKKEKKALAEKHSEIDRTIATNSEYGGVSYEKTNKLQDEADKEYKKEFAKIVKKEKALIKKLEKKSKGKESDSESEESEEEVEEVPLVKAKRRGKGIKRHESDKDILDFIRQFK